MTKPGPPVNHHRRILEELATLAAERAAFALCIVVHTSGSTYRKVGALALVRADGTRIGVISAGCLEPDLEASACAALRENRPRVAVFDTRSDDDLLYGSGSGCRGRMQVLLLPVAAGATHPLCPALCSAEHEQRALKIALVTDGPHLGGGFLWCADTEIELPPRLEAARALKQRRAGEYVLEDGSTCAIFWHRPSPRILLIGAGPEAPVLIGMANQLGWRVVVSDHRESLLCRLGGLAERTICARPAAALAALGDAGLDACIVMTHTAANDREALRVLAQRQDPFIGLLGPPLRRDELLAELDGASRAALATRLHAPVGLRLGGHGPEAVALSICAELQCFIARVDPSAAFDHAHDPLSAAWSHSADPSGQSGDNAPRRARDPKVA